jgi:hypothetical protein
VPCCGVRRKYPSLSTLTAADHEQVQNAITHGNVTAQSEGSFNRAQEHQVLKQSTSSNSR